MTNEIAFGEEVVFDEEKTHGHHIDSDDDNQF